MFVTITSITTIMRARMLRAVSPLLIWFWSAFPMAFLQFCFQEFSCGFIDVWHDAWWMVTMWKRMGVCWCVYERRRMRCRCWIMMRMCVWTVMRKCMHVMPAFEILWWRRIAFEYICGCIAREVPLVIVKIWLRCRISMLTWNIWMRKYPEFVLFSCACIELVSVLNWLRPIAFEYWFLHCSWSTAHDCEDMVAMWGMQIDVKHDIYLDAKISWNFIQTVFRFIFCSCWPPPPLFFTGSDDRTVRIWDVASQQQVAELKGHTNWVTSVAFDSSGKYLASGERRGAWAAARYNCTMNVMAFVARRAIGIWMVMVVGIGMTIATMRIIRIWNDDCCIAVMVYSAISMRPILHYNV